MSVMATPKQWTEQGFRPFRLEVLTPVFVGCGDKLSPLDYVLGGSNDVLHHIDLDAWMDAHGADKDVLAVIAQGDLRRIRRMLQEKVDPARYGTARCAMAADLGSWLRANMEKDGDNHTNEIDACMRNPLTGVPYLPGSSLKGAISTPLIDHLDAQAGADSLKSAGTEVRAQQGWMKKCFGDISEHAMQALKISDCPAGRDDAGVFRALEKGRSPEKKGTPKAPCEALRPGTLLWGRMLVAGNPPAIRLASGRSIPFDVLRDLCNAFYRKRYQEEKGKFYGLPHLRDVLRSLEPVDAALEALSGRNPPLLLRVGHYSHVECVTVERNSPRTRMGRNGTPMPFGTTRTLADGRLPFGWVLLHPCSPEEWEEHAIRDEAAGHAVWEKEIVEEIRVRGEERRARDEARRQAAERRRAEEEAAAAAAAAKEAALARLDAMSEDERRIARLREGMADEAESMEIYKQLEKMEPGDAARDLAAALRGFWQSIGKWDGSQSKKQKLKIDRVRGLLS